MSKHYDVIILGGGNAGLGASSVLHEAGRKIAIVEERDFGGTCPNRGCTPKKILVAAAHALHEIETASAHKISVGKPSLDWGALIDREKDMISPLPDAMRETAEKRADVYTGTARFVAENAVEINGERLEADDIVIATGSAPRQLPIDGAGLMITSEEVLSEREQPGEVVFVGGGVIAMEFSHVYARAGTTVTVLEAMPQVLPALDSDAVAELLTESERLGIRIVTGAKVAAITEDGKRFAVSYEADGAEHKIVADRIVNGAGRVANVADLNLEAANVTHDGGRVDVDEFLRSKSNPKVWITGDSLPNAPQLSPLATEEGKLAGRNIAEGAQHKVDYTVVPSVVYTVPALASVGLSEKAAKDAGRNVEVTASDMRDWFSGKTYAETVAWSKVLVDKETGLIAGAHIVGHRSEELIHLFSLAMQHGIKAEELKSSRYAFPTFSSDIGSMI